MKKLFLSIFVASLTLGASAFNMANLTEAKLVNKNLENLKKAPEGLKQIMAERFANKVQLKAPTFPVTTNDDLTGAYNWTYTTYEADDYTTQPDTLEASVLTTTTELVTIKNLGNDQIRLTGFAPYGVTANLAEYDGTKYFTIPDQLIYIYSSYGPVGLRGIFYYEGDDTYEAGWYLTDPMGYILDDGIMMDPDVQFEWYLTSGNYAGYSITYPTIGGSTMVPDTQYNGIMSYSTEVNDTVTNYSDDAVIISEDANYVVTVNNFAGYGNAVTFNLAEGNTFTADADQVIYTYTNEGTTYTYVLTGLDSTGETLLDVTGTGTETVLTFDCYWTGLDETNNYWMGLKAPATITWLDGTYTYPGAAVTYDKGDVNADGFVDVTDVNILVNIVLGNDTADNYDGRAYITDGDTDVDVSDVNALLAIVLGN